MNDIHDSFRRNGLVRPEGDRVFAGVCSGLGRRFGIDPWPSRLLFLLITIALPGSPIVFYPVLWILMPTENVAMATPTSVPPTA